MQCACVSVSVPVYIGVLTVVISVAVVVDPTPLTDIRGFAYHRLTVFNGYTKGYPIPIHPTASPPQ